MWGFLKCMYSRCVANCGNAPSAVCLYDTVFPIFISEKFCLSGTIQYCLFPFFLCFFCSCYRPAVSLSRQPLGRAAQVQEGVGERHEVYRCVRRYQPRQCCILSPCPVHLSNALLLLLWLFVTVQWKSTPVINSILAAVCISSVICFILLQKEVVQLVGGQIFV